mmetsp:Transcript_15056/g.50520  ORF Transcript_15056/g.50520 Transcript_15056/m.50520 type:complete len:213 (-) Transcript_15056:4648-5286(-)
MLAGLLGQADQRQRQGVLRKGHRRHVRLALRPGADQRAPGGERGEQRGRHLHGQLFAGGRVRRRGRPRGRGAKGVRAGRVAGRGPRPSDVVPGQVQRGELVPEDGPGPLRRRSKAPPPPEPPHGDAARVRPSRRRGRVGQAVAHQARLVHLEGPVLPDHAHQAVQPRLAHRGHPRPVPDGGRADEADGLPVHRVGDQVGVVPGGAELGPDDG